MVGIGENGKSNIHTTQDRLTAQIEFKVSHNCVALVSLNIAGNILLEDGLWNMILQYLLTE